MLNLARGLLFLIGFVVTMPTLGQDTTALNQVANLPNNLLGALSKKAISVECKLASKTTLYLTKLKKREKRLYKKLYRKDSNLARQTFGNIDSFYASLNPGKGSAISNSPVYSGHLDSLSTALRFLNHHNSASSFQKNLQSYADLQTRLNASDHIKKQLIQRQQLLKKQLAELDLLKELRGHQKQIYYYAAQVKEYKAVFEDPSKMEQKLMELVMKMPQFKEFFRKQSRLGQLFAIPGSSNISMTSLQGLQTRASVNQLLVDRFGSGQAATQMMQQNMQSAQGHMNQLKNKLQGLQNGSYGNGNAEMPKGFKPNTQKTKSFLKRLEWGFNFQSHRAKNYFPVTSDLGLSIGYKINDQAVAGIGGSYKLGLGRGWDHISLSHQGLSIRSYIDMKLKVNIWLAGGYERNHLSEFKNIQQLSKKSAWQESGLVGLSKRYKVSKKLKGEMKLMWDFLSYKQIPRTQAIIFRIGYHIK